ncbi:MAG TPA: hypothetical protein VMU39_26920 [Solirubrobacteraceae bacterium]|nr:hypothetical protein [Solirubrobacteraceae bacterium]
MGSKRKKASKAVPFNPADVAHIAKTNPYIQRLIDDADLRENVHKAIESTRSAYGRLADGKTPAKALLEDKKLQKDLREALEALRDASLALSEAPRKRARKRIGVGRKLLVLGLAGALALAGSEKLRSKVLDTLFGKEEEFEYTPPTSTPATPPATPVSAA